MDERPTLLRALKIEDEARRPRRRVATGAVVLTLVLAGCVALFAGKGPIAGDATAHDRAPPTEPRMAAAPAATGGFVLDASGYVVARREATVSAKLTGKLAAVLVEEGDRVKAGQIIARLDDTNARAALDLARANLNAARLAWQDARPVYARNVSLYDAGASSAQTLDMARAAYNTADSSRGVAEQTVEVAQRNLDDTLIRAPFDGVVTDKAAHEGEIVSPISAGGGFTRTGICTIVDMDTLEVEVDVNEDFVDRVFPGQRAQVTLSAYRGWRIPASVVAVVPTADRAKGTVKVRIALLAKDPRILPEMSARVEFRSKTGGTYTQE